MTILIISLFFEIKDASSLVNIDNNSNFSISLINYYNIPELTGLRVKGNKFFIYDLSLFGFSYYNEVMIGIGSSFTVNKIELNIIPYFLFFNAGNIRNVGLTEYFDMKIKYLNYEGGIILRNIIYLFKDDIKPIESIFLSYKLDNFKHSLKISYTFEKDLNLQYGMEVKLDNLTLRLGFETNPFQPSFGFGISEKNKRFEFGFVSHPLLGFAKNFTFSIVK